jgi:hypothetical protein
MQTNSIIPQSAGNATRVTAAATLALLAAVALAPSRAEASCGDYVMIGSRHARHSLPVAAGRTHDADDAAGQTPGRQVPHCHRPMCSNGSIPPAAPSPGIEMTIERWALPASTALTIPPDRKVSLAEARVFACDGFGLSILRPPR